MPTSEKDEIAERYGTTPLELDEWRDMLLRAGPNGWRGLLKAFENERVFYSAIRRRKLGYCLYRGQKPAAAP